MALLQMQEITKLFPGVVANDKVSFELEAGEVHALVGENGAGKTTLMKILYGLHAPDGGSISIKDRETAIQGPKDAIRQGIGMVHQHFMLVPTFTVLENIILGEEGRDSRLPKALRGFWIDHESPREKVETLMKSNGLTVDLDAPIETVPVGLQQRVEILKILYRGAEILVFDEPTAVLTPQEVIELFKTFRELTSQGKGIVFISHKLDEVLSIADRITVIRRGKVIETIPKESATKQSLAESMVGKPVLLKVDNPESKGGEPALKVENVTFKDEHDTVRLDSITLEVQAGEILGIAGVEGNGQTELIRAITEKTKLESGVILLAGEDITNFDVRKRRDAGLAHIPEDRRRQGLLLPFTVAQNLTLGRHHREPYCNRLQFISRSEIREFAKTAIADYDIRTPSEITPAETLSGGNQQKVIIAREMAGDPVVLVASQPTRGVDIGATEFIYKQLVAAKLAGKAVLLVSADLDEIMALSDRIGVLYKGRLSIVLDRKEATKEKVGYYMLGESDAPAG